MDSRDKSRILAPLAIAPVVIAYCELRYVEPLCRQPDTAVACQSLQSIPPWQMPDEPAQQRQSPAAPVWSLPVASGAVATTTIMLRIPTLRTT